MPIRGLLFLADTTIICRFFMGGRASTSKDLTKTTGINERSGTFRLASDGSHLHFGFLGCGFMGT